MTNKEADEAVAAYIAQEKKKNSDYQYSRRLALVYDLTPEKYTEQLAWQKGVCAICKSPPGKRRLAVDHDTVTKKNRGLLCVRCNVGLGYFKDNPEFLQTAIKYLDAFNKRNLKAILTIPPPPPAERNPFVAPNHLLPFQLPPTE